jgi:rhomboid family GlyGly-CTERM serine protease
MPVENRPDDSTILLKPSVNKSLLRRVNETVTPRRRIWLLLLVIAMAAVLLEAGGPAVKEWARYERTPLANGELWRLLTGQLVHLGWGHLWPNLAALGLLGLLLEDVMPALEWAAAAVIAALAIDAGLYWLAADVDWYVGLSGVLHGLAACGAVELARRGNRVGFALALGVLGKITYEQIFGPVPFTQASAGGPVIVAAHLYGATAGVATAAAFVFVRARRTRL